MTGALAAAHLMSGGPLESPLGTVHHAGMTLRGPRRTIQQVARWARSITGRCPPIWYHADYRLPLSTVESATGMEPRRADLVAWYLLQRRIIEPGTLCQPEEVAFSDLARVHAAELLESLDDPVTLARVFGVEPHGLPVAELMRTVRLACGGTLAAARAAVGSRRPAMNLLGGFHHAGTRRAGGFCAVNDVAVAAATMRAEGRARRIVVLDLDAHPPDGTAECLATDRDVWVGSLSGSAWTVLSGVDETVLPVGCDDATYLTALERLLGRMPRADLAFVLAGGDVLAGDRFGALGLSLAGTRRRDVMVADALEGTPSVWLPAGGYGSQSWKVLAGTALVLCGRAGHRILSDADPLRRRFAELSVHLSRGLGDELDLTVEDLEGPAGADTSPRLLGEFDGAGVARAFDTYGVTTHLGRLGYHGLRFGITLSEAGDSVRVFGHAQEREHLLIECTLQRRTVDRAQVLWVNWLALRNPLARHLAERPLLPGQDVPGLGMAREAGAMLAIVARSLGLRGVGFRPAWYHTAYAARHLFVFVDPQRQARFQAMVRDLAGLSLREASMAVANGRVTMDGAPYTWEPADMVFWLPGERAARSGAVVQPAAARFALSASPDA